MFKNLPNWLSKAQERLSEVHAEPDFAENLRVCALSEEQVVAIRAKMLREGLDAREIIEVAHGIYATIDPDATEVLSSFFRGGMTTTEAKEWMVSYPDAPLKVLRYEVKYDPRAKAYVWRHSGAPWPGKPKAWVFKDDQQYVYNPKTTAPEMIALTELTYKLLILHPELLAVGLPR